MTKSNNDENKQPSILGIPLGNQSSGSEKAGQLFGISIASDENSNSTSYYVTPAITQSLNLLELTLKKTDFDKSDFETLRATLSLIPIGEISLLRPTISASSLDNLTKKADIYEKTQLNENTQSNPLNQNEENKNKNLENENTQLNTLNQNEENKNKNLENENNFLNNQDSKNSNLNQKSLSKEDEYKLMADFLSERNDLNQVMEEKNKQNNLENQKQTNLSN
jgi:hypothetical protein